MTAKEIALKILALPEEQQNVPMVFEYYDDAESSVPSCAEIDSIGFCSGSYPFTKPHISLNQDY